MTAPAGRASEEAAGGAVRSRVDKYVGLDVGLDIGPRPETTSRHVPVGASVVIGTIEVQVMPTPIAAPETQHLAPAPVAPAPVPDQGASTSHRALSRRWYGLAQT